MLYSCGHFIESWNIRTVEMCELHEQTITINVIIAKFEKQSFSLLFIVPYT